MVTKKRAKKKPAKRKPTKKKTTKKKPAKRKIIKRAKVSKAKRKAASKSARVKKKPTKKPAKKKAAKKIGRPPKEVTAKLLLKYLRDCTPLETCADYFDMDYATLYKKIKASKELQEARREGETLAKQFVVKAHKHAAALGSTYALRQLRIVHLPEWPEDPPDQPVRKFEVKATITMPGGDNFLLPENSRSITQLPKCKPPADDNE